MIAVSDSLKAQQIRTLEQILPDGVEVRQMLLWWQEFDERYWQGELRPCWLNYSIIAYGHAIGLYDSGSRTITLAKQLWRGSEELRRAVMIHEMCHQAQWDRYEHLNKARGPRGAWTDTSHRCPAWSRALEDVIKVEGLEYFVPVWHRSSGNVWSPWIPADDGWTSWKKVSPDAEYDGRRLLSFEESKRVPAAHHIDSIAAGMGVSSEYIKM